MKNKRKYIEPGLLPDGYEQEDGEIEEMSIYDKVEEAIIQRRDDGLNRGGEADKAYLTTYAPTEIAALAGDNPIWLVSDNPLKIRIGDSPETIDVQPDWIVLENIEKQDLSSIIRRQIDLFMGLNEIDSGSPSYGGTTNIGATKSSLAFSQENYNDPQDAYKVLKDSSKQVSSEKQIDSKTLKHFLVHVYKGGDHSVTYKKLAELLQKRGIRITDRREQRVAKLEKVKI